MNTTSEHIILLAFNNILKNIERHAAHTIVSWPNPKQWVIVLIGLCACYLFHFFWDIKRTNYIKEKMCLVSSIANVVNLTLSWTYRRVFDLWQWLCFSAIFSPILSFPTSTIAPCWYTSSYIFCNCFISNLRTENLDMNIVPQQIVT